MSEDMNWSRELVTPAELAREEARLRSVERFGKCWRDFRTWFHHHDTGTSLVHSINYHAIKKNREKVEMNYE